MQDENIMCDCIKTIEEKVLAQIKENNKNLGVITETKMLHRTLSFGKNGGWRSYNDIQYDFTQKKKDGSMGKTIYKTISIFHTFCPWCGVKIVKEDSETD